MTVRIEKEFALSGDKTAVPTDSTSTELSFDKGWTSAYELAKGTAGARDVSRPQHNYLWSVISGNTKQWQEQAFPQYFSDIAYQDGAVVRYTDNENYICHTAQAAGTLPTDHSAFINIKFYGAYTYAVSQLSNGGASLVGFIYEGQTVDSYDYLIYPGDGRIYARGSATGTTTGAFNPVDGTATGLSAPLSLIIQLGIATTGEINSGVDNKIVTADNLASSEYGFSVGFRYVDEKASRAWGTTYTNNENYVIEVSVTGVATTSNIDATIEALIDGSPVKRLTAGGSTTTSARICLSVFVGPGEDFRFNVTNINPAIVYWMEYKKI